MQKKNTDFRGRVATNSLPTESLVMKGQTDFKKQPDH